MLDRNYYVICDDNCRFPAMTKEEVIAAIAEATGETPVHIDDAFITKLKEQNKNTALKFWVGTTAQYNAISFKEENVFYILTDDTFADDVNGRLDGFEQSLEEIEQTVGGLGEKVNEIYDPAKTLKVEDFTTDDYRLVTNWGENYGYRERLLHNGLYMVRVKLTRYETDQYFSFMFDFKGGRKYFRSATIKYNNKNYQVVARPVAPYIGEFQLSLLDVDTDSDEQNVEISVRRIGEEYAIG